MRARARISRFIKEDGIKGIVTGDISFVDSYHGNWIDDVCRGLNVEVIKPFWGLDRHQILNQLVSQGFKAVFTCVRNLGLMKNGWFASLTGIV